MQVYKKYTYIGPGYQDTPVFKYTTTAEKPNAINEKEASTIRKDIDLINEGIYRVLNTRAWSSETNSGGERPFQLDFGSHLAELPFEQNDLFLQDLATRFITEALSLWEPRIQVIQVDINDEPDEHALSATIHYITLVNKMEVSSTAVFLLQ